MSTEATWSTLLGSVELLSGQFLIYLDPDALDAPASSAGITHRACGRWELRRIVEQHPCGTAG